MDLFFFAGLRLDSVTKNNAQTANVVDFSVLFFFGISKSVGVPWSVHVAAVGSGNRLLLCYIRWNFTKFKVGKGFGMLPSVVQ